MKQYEMYAEEPIYFCKHHSDNLPPSTGHVNLAPIRTSSTCMDTYRQCEYSCFSHTFRS